ncbi:hypothetical protein O5D80_001882 [Batrachochytrium dendrobatidis]|nr:hypothetical protein O5D80_001882 [Batrachochytrium dendrobatidis]
MKLAVAVLSSILLACSVTTANPAPHSMSKNYISITAKVFDVNGIYMADPNIFTDDDKTLIKDYAKKKKIYEEALKARNSARTMATIQQKRVFKLGEKHQRSRRKYHKGNNTSKYKSKLQKLKSDLEKQSSKLSRIQKHRHVLESNYDLELLELTLVDRILMKLIFKKFTTASLVNLRVDFKFKILTIVFDRVLYDALLNQLLEAGDESTSGTQNSSQTHQDLQNQQQASQASENLPPSYDDIVNNPEYKLDLGDSKNSLPSYEDVINNPERYNKYLENSDTEHSSSEETSRVDST